MNKHDGTPDERADFNCRYFRRALLEGENCRSLPRPAEFRPWRRERSCENYVRLPQQLLSEAAKTFASVIVCIALSQWLYRELPGHVPDIVLMMCMRSSTK